MKRKTAGDSVRTLSDRQLMALIRAHRPEYRENLKVELPVNRQHTFNIRTLTDAELKARLATLDVPTTNPQA